MLLFSSILIASCGDSRTVAEYEAWINDPEQGLRRSRNIDGVDITLGYLPPELLIHRELKGEEGLSRDSLRRQYAGTLTFLMTIQPSDVRGSDVMTRGIASQQELNGRMMTMNFDIGELISMNTSSGTARPVLSHFESSYGLKKERNVLMTFESDIGGKPVLQGDSLDIVFVDKVFDTGIHHFIFETSRIRAASELFPSDSL